MPARFGRVVTGTRRVLFSVGHGHGAGRERPGRLVAGRARTLLSGLLAYAGLKLLAV